MIQYIQIINKIKNVKEEAIEDFNKYVSVPMILSNQTSLIKKDGENIKIEKNSHVYEIDIETRKAFSEIISILKNIEVELYNKIDYKYIDFFEKFKDVNYYLNYENDFNNLELKYLTLEILTIFNLKFWCLDDDRKVFLENLKSIQKKELVEEPIEEIQDDENLEIMKNNWWMNLLNKIRKIKRGKQK